MEAAIAAIHAGATTPEETNWTEIAFLYNELYRMNPTPVVALNRAVAVALASDPAGGLVMLEELEEPLDRYYLYHSARARLLEMDGATDEAGRAYRRALELVTNDAERRFLESRLDALT